VKFGEEDASPFIKDMKGRRYGWDFASVTYMNGPLRKMLVFDILIIFVRISFAISMDPL
jgi:hypothetical protein